MDSERTTNSPEETIELAREYALKLGAGRIVTLEGDLGGGKTVFAKGYGTGLGVEDTDYITSPTFTLVNRYTGSRGVIYHIDLYRLHSSNDAADIGIEEMLCSGNTVIIEWAERIEDILVSYTTVNINIEVLDETTRVFRITE